MPENFDLRYRLSKTSTLEEMVVVSRDLRDRMMPYHTGEKPWEPDPGEKGESGRRKVERGGEEERG